MSKELHCLAQGCTAITKGTNTIFFLLHADICNIPSDRIVTYACIVINDCTQKEDPNHVHITVRGNLIDYPFELTTQTADIVSSKILWNSVISTKDAHVAGADIRNMYLKAPLDQFDYIKILIALLPQDIIQHYQLQEKVFDGYAYIEIRKGMYGLPQAGILANKLHKERLACHGYFKQLHTLGLWKHAIFLVWFNLCVDNFGIKYIGREHLQHLYDALRKETYEIVEDWTGNLYCGITLKWNYKKHHVDLAVPAYVMKQLTNTVTLLPYNHSIACMHSIPSHTAKKTNCPLPLMKVLA
jgi:hypothetical protein